MTNTYTQSKGNPRSVGYFDENGNKTETKVGGDPAWRNNNPGNIKWDGIGHQNYFRGTLGAIGSNGTFAIFPTWEDGQKAKLNLFKTGTQYKGLSIEGAMNKYAPSSENDTAGYIKFIRDKTGLDTNKKWEDLTPEEYQKWMDAITDYESRGQQHGKGISIPPEQDQAHPEVPAFPNKLTPDQMPPHLSPGDQPKTSDAAPTDQVSPPDNVTMSRLASAADLPPDNTPTKDYLTGIAPDGDATQMAAMGKAINSDDDPDQPDPAAPTPDSQADAVPDGATSSTFAQDLTGDDTPLHFAAMGAALNTPNDNDDIPASQDAGTDAAMA